MSSLNVEQLEDRTSLTGLTGLPTPAQQLGQLIQANLQLAQSAVTAFVANPTLANVESTIALFNVSFQVSETALFSLIALGLQNDPNFLADMAQVSLLFTRIDSVIPH